MLYCGVREMDEPSELSADDKHTKQEAAEVKSRTSKMKMKFYLKKNYVYPAHANI